jgi:predicted deacylase
MLNSPPDYFSPDYFIARQNFCAKAENLGWIKESFLVEQNLFIDVAISAHLPNRPTILLSSGLHGGEGFFGSAVQLALLAAGDLSIDFNWVLVHALNPYGFANLRRCNENNIDLNRNFLLGNERYQGSSPIYGNISSILNPEHIGKIDWFVPQMLGVIARYGLKNIWQAVAEGQYDFPKGLFFGGQAASKTQQILQEHLPRWIGESSTILHLDFHTGLGKWGTYKLLMDTIVTSTELQQLQTHFGTESILAIDGGKKKYQVRGSIGSWTQQLLRPRSYYYLCAEFGTYSFAQVLMTLYQENYVHNWLTADHPFYIKIKQRMKEIFCPESGQWRSLVLTKSREIINQAEQAARELS